MKRLNITSGTTWEEKVGYSRAVKVGNQVFVSGTTSVNADNKVVGIGNPYEQTKFILQKISDALQKAGATFEDVVRTRIFVVNIKDWEKISKAHGEVFKEIKPAATMVEVTNLISPELLVEIEVDAIVQN